MVKSNYTGIYSLSIQSTTEKSAVIFKDSRYWIFFNFKRKFWHTSYEVFGLLIQGRSETTTVHVRGKRWLVLIRPLFSQLVPARMNRLVCPAALPQVTGKHGPTWTVRGQKATPSRSREGTRSYIMGHLCSNRLDLHVRKQKQNCMFTF